MPSTISLVQQTFYGYLERPIAVTRVKDKQKLAFSLDQFQGASLERFFLGSSVLKIPSFSVAAKS